MKSEQRYWFVLYTRPLWEQKVQFLVKQFLSIETWCPLKKIARRWSDRIKTIEEPYFRNYVFIYASDKERITALRTDGVIDCVRFNGGAAKVSEEEIKSIKDFIGEHSDVEVRGIEPGDRVLFYSGAFVDQQAVVQRIDGNKLILALSKLNCMMITTLADVIKVG